MYGSFISSDAQLLKISSAIEELDVKFRAFLTDISQTFGSTWNSEQVYGRNDPIATFASTKRTISVAWDVPSANPAEAKENLEKCNTLIKMAYPSYIKAREPGFDVIAKNPLVKVSFGNLISDKDGDPLLGFIESINWKPVLDMGMFNNTQGEFFPKVISLSFNFTVLHQEPLGQESSKAKNFPFKIN